MAEQAQSPTMKTITQYAKSIHFTNDAVANKSTNRGNPKINVKVNVIDEKLSDNRFAVTLDMQVEANADDDAVFTVELEYMGVFEIAGVPDDKLPIVVRVECPRLLFPFARRVIADSTREGGFPPLFLDPIDFLSLFMQQRKAAAEAAPKVENGAG